MGQAYRWIADDAALLAVAQEVRPGPLALDTEADSFHHYRDKVCLIQLAFRGANVLVDPLAGADIRVLATLLEDPSLLKLLHGADYDIRILHRDFGIGLRGIFDTMVAARLCGETAVGLGALLERHLGVKLDKTHQRADWSQRPLPSGMLDYAVADTSRLEELATLFREKLQALGRLAWAEEEFRRLESVRWRVSEDVDPEAFRRVKGAAKLDARGLALLRAVWTWRDATARERDRPPFRVLRDEVLLEVVRSSPEDREALAAIAGFPAPLYRGRGAAAILERLREAREITLDRCPAPSAEPSRRDRTLDEAVAELRKGRDAIALELGIEPAILASRSVLEAIAERVRAGQPVDDLPDLRAWQKDLLRPLL